MSAIEQLPLPSDRRNGTRVRLDRMLAARIGRNDGLVVDLSVSGARVRHSGTLLRGATVRMTFDWSGRKFAAGAEVLSSRVVMLGTREGESATYETRLRFMVIDNDARELLARMLQAITSEELRGWVENLKGFEEETRSAAAPRTSGYIRCRRVGNSWERKWTRDCAQPRDGFVLPAGTSAAEVEALCKAWVEMGDDARWLVQRTAEAVVEESGVRQR